MFLSNLIISKINYVSVVKYKKNETSEMNKRPQYGLAFSLGGELVYKSAKETLALNKSKVVLLSKNTNYKVRCTFEGSFAIINFDILNEPNFPDFFTVNENAAELLKPTFEKLHNSFAKNFYDSFSYFYKMLAILGKNEYQKNIPSTLYNALNYIEKNFASYALCNKEIAKAANISEVYLRKLFTKHLSTSIKKHIKVLRMAKAKTLLEETSLPIIEIAEECGYSSAYYFSKAFKSSTNFCPTEYRNSFKRNLL